MQRTADIPAAAQVAAVTAERDALASARAADADAERARLTKALERASREATTTAAAEAPAGDSAARTHFRCIVCTHAPRLGFCTNVVSVW